MNPRQYLDLAERLVQGPGTAEYRTSISRAYYAAYKVADQFLVRMGFAASTANYHVTLQRRLLNSGDDELKQIGGSFGDFHRRRIRADYRMDDARVEERNLAETACAEARRIINVFDSCPIYSKRWKQIQEAIRKAIV